MMKELFSLLLVHLSFSITFVFRGHRGLGRHFRALGTSPHWFDWGKGAFGNL